MKVLLDENLSRRLRTRLPGHLVMSAASMGWRTLKNGELLNAAEGSGFQLMITADQSIFYQQNNLRRHIALLVLSTNDWQTILLHLDEIRAAIERTTPNGYEELELTRKGPRR